MEKADDLGAERIKFAGSTGRAPRPIAGAHRPLGDGPLVQPQYGGGLGDGQPVTFATLTNLLERFVIDQAAPPSAWRRMSATLRAGTSVDWCEGATDFSAKSNT